MALPRAARHDFINPPILPDIMRLVLQKCFFIDGAAAFPLFTPDYFTAKNVVTGAIEITENTYTVHHFESCYHSPSWREARALTQRVFALFGARSPVVKIIIKGIALLQRIGDFGLRGAVIYYARKYFGKKSGGGAVTL
jgi:hypothetical protein